MKLIQFIIIIIFFLHSCDKSDGGQTYYNVDIAFQIEIIDSFGNDLLNPNFEDSFNLSEISYYKLDKDGNKVLMILGNDLIIAPSNNNGTSKYFLHITTLGTKQPDGNYLSYLKLSRDITDTIKVKTIEKKESIYKDKVWFNNNLVWNKTDLNILPITITK